MGVMSRVQMQLTMEASLGRGGVWPMWSLCRGCMAASVLLAAQMLSERIIIVAHTGCHHVVVIAVQELHCHICTDEACCLHHVGGCVTLFVIAGGLCRRILIITGGLCSHVGAITHANGLGHILIGACKVVGMSSSLCVGCAGVLSLLWGL